MIWRVWRWLFSPCLFGHEDRLFELGADRRLVWVCPRCRDARRVWA